MKTGISTTIATLMLGMVAATSTGATAATLDGVSGHLYRLYQFNAGDPFTIADDIEFTAPADQNSGSGYPSLLPVWSISGTQIKLQTGNGGQAAYNFSPLNFNGYKIEFSSDPGIVGVTFDPALSLVTGALPDITFTSDSISFDFSDRYFAGTYFFDVELASTGSTETPLPAALPLFATGLGALGLIAQRRKRKTKA